MLYLFSILLLFNEFSFSFLVAWHWEIVSLLSFSKAFWIFSALLWSGYFQAFFDLISSLTFHNSCTWRLYLYCNWYSIIYYSRNFFVVFMAFLKISSGWFSFAPDFGFFKYLCKLLFHTSCFFTKISVTSLCQEYIISNSSILPLIFLMHTNKGRM